MPPVGCNGRVGRSRAQLVWFWTRASLRRNLPALIGIAVLLGALGGLALFAAAGARRTQSAYPRFLWSTNPSTMVVDVGGLDDGGYDALRQIAALPGVEQARAYAGFYAAPWVNGQFDLSQNFEAIGSIDGRFFVQDRFTPLDGRLADPARDDEVMVNEEAARQFGYHVGQRIDFATVSRADVETPTTDPSQLQPRLMTHATIVAVGAFVEEVLQDDTDRSPLVLFTPAYVQAAKGLETYAWQGLVLRDGTAGVAAVQHEITARSGAGPQLFRVVSTDVFHAEQAIRPVSLALAVFALISGVACVVLVGQALARHVRSQGEAREVARALGTAPAGTAALLTIGPAIAVLTGALLAAVIATLASPLMPIGRVRRVEIDRGIDVDWAVFGVGIAVFVMSALSVLALAALRDTRRRTTARLGHRSSRLSRAVEAANLPPGIALGAHFTLGASHRVRVRSVIVSSAVAIAALVAAAAFGSSMHDLVSHPRLYGWNWDVAVVDSAGYGNTNPIETQRVLSADPDVSAWGGAFYGADEIDGVSVPLLGMDPGSEVTPPIHSGRMIAGPGEIVLGTATAHQLKVSIGDTVNSSSGPLRVVGSATLPTIGVVHGDHTSLGIGGIVVTKQVPGYDRNQTGIPADQYGPNVLFVRFHPGVDRAAATARLQQLAPEFSDYGESIVTPVQRSAEIVNADAITGSSTLLAAAVAVAAVASFALAFGLLVRRRRRDLALLKAIGFSGRQVTTAVAAHATTIVVSGLVIGVPVGVAVGRAIWSRFAEQLDVLAHPVVPVVPVVLTVVVALVAANVLAIVTTRRARSAPAATVLHEE